MRFRVSVSSATSPAAPGSGRRRDASPVRAISAAADDTRASGARPRRVSAAAARAPTPAASTPDSRNSSAEPVQRLVDLARARGDEHDAARGRPAVVGQGRREQAQRLTVQTHGGEAAAPAAQRLGGRVRLGQQLGAERQRAGDETPVAVEDLDRQLAPGHGGLECARRRQQRRGRHAEALDVGGSPAQAAVQRGVELMADEHPRADREEGDREHDRERRGGGEPPSQRSRPHVRNMKPTPRTV